MSARTCPTHFIPLMLHFYDRPGSPMGNGYVCPWCLAERQMAGIMAEAIEQWLEIGTTDGLVKVT